MIRDGKRDTPFLLFSHIVRGVFVARPNRFIVECTVNNRLVRAYLPNPGRLWELLFPGTLLFLTTRGASYEGSTDYTVVAVERDGTPVMLHTHANNLVARYLIEENKVPGLEGARVVKPEAAIGNSRFDFLLNRNNRNIVVEVKSCTLVGNSIAMFPDAITARGRKHLLELARLAEEGTEAVVIFLVHWPRTRYFMPEYHTDLEFSRTLLAVKDRVAIKALSVEWTKDLSPGRIQELFIPWRVIEKEAHDRGSYILILRLKRDRRLAIGGLGAVRFRKGYYLYVGSAKANLRKRVERHQQSRKKLFWHIDYLRSAADFHAALPIRASEDLECAIASTLGKIAAWRVPRFGSSDCSCDGHLFGMAENPVHNPAFIKLLQYYRIDRLETFLGPAEEVEREVQARVGMKMR